MITFAHVVIGRKLRGKNTKYKKWSGRMITFSNAAARLKDDVYTTDYKANKLNDYFYSRSDQVRGSGKKHKS